MAEGDTLKRAELRLKPILLNQQVDALWFRKLRGNKPRAGQTITAVAALGKNLLIEFDGKLVLRSHLGMYGSWKAYSKKPDFENLRYKPKTTVAISTPLGTAVCTAPQRVETYAKSKPPSDLSNLGPDLTADEFDLEVVKQSAVAKPNLMLCELLLNQQVACGIGNIYKSETLFLERLDPFQQVKETSEQQIQNLFIQASTLLRRNSRDGKQVRRTSDKGQYYVYERNKLPCRKCMTPIRRSYQGEYKRSTYWCPQCQPVRVIKLTG